MNPGGNHTSTHTSTCAITGTRVLGEGTATGLGPVVDVVLRDGVIADVGEGAAARHAGCVCIDGAQTFVMPGLVNAHTHSGENLRRGVASGLGYDHWMSAVWSPINQMTAQEAAVAATLGAVEMLKRGVTSVLDHFRRIPMDPECALAAARACEAAGLQATLALMVRDDMGGSVDGQLAVCAELLGRNSQAGPCMARFAIGPSSPIRCSDDLLVRAAELARRHQALLHMHLDETREHRDIAQARFGRSAVAHLQALGLLGPSTSLAHAVWVSAADMDLLAASRAVVVHNPVSNMRLGSGRAPVARMRRAGVTVALGSDGAASNDSQDVLEAAKFALMAARSGPETDHGDWLTVADVLQMAGDGGRAALGQAPRRVAPGMPADLAVIDLDSPAMAPLNDAAAQLVLGGAGVRVRHTFSAGLCVVRDGQVTTVDEAALYAEARDIAARRATPIPPLA